MADTDFYKERIYPVLFMLILTVVCISLVSGVSIATAERVRINETLYQKRAVLVAAGIDLPSTDRELEALFESRVQTRAEGRYFRIISESGNAIDAVVLKTEGPGVWGEIEVMIGFENDLKTMIYIDFTRQNETPGLGARITENWFTRQFRGKHAPFRLVDEGTSSPDPNEMDAITGATNTSRFVRDIMNQASEELRVLVEGGQ